jgi:hypothetical protein
LERSKGSAIGGKGRSATKASEKKEAEELTPELSRKKEYLKKVRNFKLKKGQVDAYEQVLM